MTAIAPLWLYGFFFRVVVPAAVPVSLLVGTVTNLDRGTLIIVVLLLWVGFAIFWGGLLFGLGTLARRLFLRLREAAKEGGRTLPRP